MRIVLLTPGTGNFLCGSCLRDNALALALRDLGHDAIIVPLYLPFALEDDPAAGKREAEDASVWMGGINVYLAQKLPFLRHLPRFLLDRLDSPRLLRWAAGRSNMTGAAEHGDLMLSMLRGEHGRQRAELHKLVHWLRTIDPPDVVILSNAMLVGLAREIRQEVGCPVLCTLQGEAPFLDALREPPREACWRAIGERARELAGCLAVSRYTGDLMRERLDLDPARVHVVWNGIDPAGFAPPPAPPTGPPTVGYVARLCRDKGIETLFEAFSLVKREVPDARLDAAGVVLGDDQVLIDDLQRRADQRGFGADVSFRANVSREDKIALLQGLTAFSVPATYGESFGLFVLEALACGVPVVQPRHGAFPELVEATGGGVLCAPDDPAALAEGLVTLLRDPAAAREMGARGRAAVLEQFSAERMAREVERVCRMTAGSEPLPAS